MGVADQARSLYEALRALEHKAATARRKAGLPSSRREAAATAGRPPYSTLVDARRISSWVPADPGLAQVPRAEEADKVWALVRVWSEWAGDKVLQQRYWRDLIDAAQPSRTRRPLAETSSTRSAYLQQVRRIAPPELKGRDAELAELAAFCLRPGGGPFVWWQAGAWAGKSALLSTFVLYPPGQVADRVRVVSFFITARLAGQDTREAFVQVLLEQLAELTGQELPAVLPEVTRETFMLELLGRAAAACRGKGGRLVLVIDGLDEDQGVTTGPHAHSIAALLPAAPPAGMRVIVSGRPNPPVPDDVPDWHPLRDPGIIRPLSASPSARDLQRLGRQELQRLLRGTEIEQDLLGLVTAARGGLSGADLAELSGAPLWEVEAILHTVAGRTFTRRAGQQAFGTGPEAYLLGHEELQAAAAHYLAGRLEGYYERLHAWADGYRVGGWPPETPEYLLSGYYRLLAVLGELPRMAACAGDAARHDRLLEATGGDGAALAEIRNALDAVAARKDPDLARALALACHCDLLTGRNTNIPATLPAVWATLGQGIRAQAMAACITGPVGDRGRQARALTLVAQALATAGQGEQAGTAACSITEPDGQAEALARVAQVLADAGQREQAARIARRAETVARSITDTYGQENALARVAGALASTGQDEKAETVARSITSPRYQAEALARVAEALARAGQPEQAARIARQAETVARSLTVSFEQQGSLALVAEALASTGQLEQAETLVRSTHAYNHQKTLARVAEELASAGQLDQAVALAKSDRLYEAKNLAQVAGALARTGQHEQASRIAQRATAVPVWAPDTDPGVEEGPQTELAETLARAGQRGPAEAAARAIIDPKAVEQALAQVAGGLARAGQYEQAEMVALSITDSDAQAEALAQVAGALAETGQHEQATRIARQAETAARSIDSYRQAKDLTLLTEALIGAGQHQEAHAVACSITSSDAQAKALAQVAEALAGAGQRDQAEAVARQAQAVARSVTNPYAQPEALAKVAEALARAEQDEQAQAVARSITNPPWNWGPVTDWQALALANVAEALAKAGQYERAETLARSITRAKVRSSLNVDDTDWQAVALARVAEALGAAGQRERADAVARSIGDPKQRAEALARVAEALAIVGQREQAARIAWQAEAVARSIGDPKQQAEALARVAEALAIAGQHEQAEAMVRSIQSDYALGRVAGALAMAGQHERAEAMARDVTDPESRDSALAKVAGGLTRMGHYRLAETVACSITRPYYQRGALVNIAEALARAGETHSARRVAAFACVAGEWTASLPLVLLLEPSAFAALAQVLNDRWHLHLSEPPEPAGRRAPPSIRSNPERT